MLYQYSYRLGSYTPQLDPDAKAYIASVETALSSPITATQKNAINTFFKTGKSAGWYSSIKRLYLPIWADAAANSIDMITRTSGTFSIGGVDHSNVGYVQGDGVSGEFVMSGTMSGDGLTTSSGMMFVGRKSTVASTAGVLGNTSPGRTLIIAQSIGKMRSDWGDTSNIFITAAHNDTGSGFFVSTRNATGIRHTLRTSSTRLLDSVAVAASGSILSGPAKLMVISTFRDTSHYLAAGWGLPLSDADDAAFTLALKDLWETASGLTLT